MQKNTESSEGQASDHEPQTLNPQANLSSETDDGSPSPGGERRGEGGISPSGSRRFTGKVARLPQTIRYLVNQMLDEGTTYKAIVARLADLGYPGFFEQNIQRWKVRGYQEWVGAQRELDLERARQESFAHLFNNSKEKSNLTEASHYLAALQTYRALVEMQDKPSSEILGPRANTYFRLMRLVTRQGAELTRRQRLALKKDTSEQSLIDQLVADPGKLEALLTAVRDRIARTANTSTHE